MPEPDTQASEEIKRLQRCVGDLASILALPAIWTGGEPCAVIRTLLDALLRLLDLDVIYLQIKDRPGEVTRISSARGLDLQPQELCETLRDWLGENPRDWPVFEKKKIGQEEFMIVPMPLGSQGKFGLFMAGSLRPDFPTQTEKLLLTVAANQATVGFQEARLLEEQKRVAHELDQRVEQRTRELAVANEELRTAFKEIESLKDQLHNENVALREEISNASMFEEIVGSSEALQNVLRQIAKVAPTDSTVLIEGETGTGKELIARAIHKRSTRANRAFICVNCAAIPPSLIASELFGHEKGSFTGALQRRLGRFELANGGTIMLDEVGELPLEMQTALLRVLQEREFERVGGNHPIRVDVRVLAATNRDLETAISDGSFRKDLFYRLNVFPIHVPALRERKDDISLLVEYLVDRYAQKAGKRIRSISKRTLQLFQSYDWPGNVRELQNVIERAVILCEGETFHVDASWLKPAAIAARANVPFAADVAEHEKAMIEQALRDSRGIISGADGAAEKLGLPRQTLESKLKKLGINRYRYKGS